MPPGGERGARRRLLDGGREGRRRGGPVAPRVRRELRRLAPEAGEEPKDSVSFARPTHVGAAPSRLRSSLNETDETPRDGTRHTAMCAQLWLVIRTVYRRPATRVRL